MMTEIQEKGMSTDNEVKMRTASGKVFWAYISAVATTFDGRSAMFSAFNDISERKRMDDALRVTNSKLMLLSSISRHDLMNQLVALSGYLRQAEGSREEATIKATYRKMEANLASVQHMMEFMKDYQELGVTAPGWFGICDLIDAARSKLSLDKISVACDLNGAQVYGDALLEKVFYNLFDNTLRHGVKVTTVTIQLEERLGGTAIIYQDDGVGVAAEDKERIFQRGFGKNSGLGLFLSREILGITGMSIQENGDPGKGARFEIFVPSSVFRSGNA
jgi:signal transduction histidine kinase